VVAEGEFEAQVAPTCRCALGQAVFQFAAFFARELGVDQFLDRFVEFVFREFAGGKQDQLLAGLARGVEKGAIVGVLIRVPGDDGKPFEAPG